MLRATSEIAVASSVWSVFVRSRVPASSRARWRAVTTSASDSMAITDSCSSTTVGGLLPGPLQQGEPLFEIERRQHVLEAHSELHHGERDLGLDLDDHGLCFAQAGHLGDALKRA